MLTLLDITPKANLQLICVFSNGVTKNVDLTTIATTPAFLFLHTEQYFTSVKNKGYFIEWTNFEADLSADTLWHIGV